MEKDNREHHGVLEHHTFYTQQTVPHDVIMMAHNLKLQQADPKLDEEALPIEFLIVEIIIRK